MIDPRKKKVFEPVLKTSAISGTKGAMKAKKVEEKSGAKKKAKSPTKVAKKAAASPAPSALPSPAAASANSKPKKTTKKEKAAQKSPRPTTAKKKVTTSQLISEGCLSPRQRPSTSKTRTTAKSASKKAQANIDPILASLGQKFKHVTKTPGKKKLTPIPTTFAMPPNSISNMKLTNEYYIRPEPKERRASHNYVKPQPPQIEKQKSAPAPAAVPPRILTPPSLDCIKLENILKQEKDKMKRRNAEQRRREFLALQRILDAEERLEALELIEKQSKSLKNGERVVFRDRLQKTTVAACQLQTKIQSQIGLSQAQNAETVQRMRQAQIEMQIQHQELEAKVRAQERLIAQQANVADHQAFLDIAKKVHDPPVEAAPRSIEMLPQGSQGMDREQVQLYKKKQRDQARLISDLELQKEADVEEERLNQRTKSVELLVQREKSQERQSKNPTPRSPASEVPETPVVAFPFLPERDESINEASATMDELEEQPADEATSVQQAPPMINLPQARSSMSSHQAQSLKFGSPDKTKKAAAHTKSVGSTTTKKSDGGVSKPKKSPITAIVPLKSTGAAKTKTKAVKKVSAGSKK